MPNRATVGDVISGTVTATLQGPASLDSDGGDRIYATYAWQTVGVWESDDGGQTVAFTPYTGDLSIAYNASGTGVATGTNTTRFDGLFSDAGYYIVEVQCTADVHDCSTGAVIGTLSGVAYIGGTASDVGEGGDTALSDVGEGGGGSGGDMAMAMHGLRADAAPAPPTPAPKTSAAVKVVGALAPADDYDASPFDAEKLKLGTDTVAASFQKNLVYTMAGVGHTGRYAAIAHGASSAKSVLAILNTTHLLHICGHGDAGGIIPGPGGYITGIPGSIPTPSGGTMRFAGIRGHKMTHVLVALYLGCNSGITDPRFGNIVSESISAGAASAVGFTNKIDYEADYTDGTTQYPAAIWARTFWFDMAHGSTVQQACDDALSEVKSESPDGAEHGFENPNVQGGGETIVPAH